ncbi:unnamed protein product [Effrenium voratum]|uniref:Uncharacterized protein n=1 Tax=Effrenium voratum TaxID=2562239 RepID=A0AA36JND8_9DINO|nr:unnamed protein product [Effrenium voratum]CAJ1445389.1 unnamed protein product [Effrenium voratum]
MEFFRLAELNESTAKLGTWLFRVEHVISEEYEYEWKGKQHRTWKLTMVLLTQEASEYCLGQVKVAKSNLQQVQTAERRYTVGTLWQVSKVALAKESKQYVHTPRKLVIDMAKSKVVSVSDAQGLVMPPTVVANAVLRDILQLQDKQRFDVTCVVKGVSDPRTVTTPSGEKRVLDATLTDGTAEMTLSLWFEMGEAGEAGLASLRENVAESSPLTFCGLEAEPSRADDSKALIKTTRHTFFIKATGEKAEELKRDADDIKARQLDLVSQAWVAHSPVDYLNTPVQQTTCFLLEKFRTVIEQDTVLQLNFVQVLPPTPGSSVKTKDGSRLWFSTAMSDASGTVDIVVREKAALALSGCANAEEFESAFQDLWACAVESAWRALAPQPWTAAIK